LRGRIRLAGEQRDPHRLGLAHLGRHFRQHCDGAGDVESADADLHARRAKLARDVHRAGKLVRLHADDADERPSAAALQVADDSARHDATVGFVVGFDPEDDA
jgi:hypothetical protein